MATLDYPIKLIKDNFIMTKENQLWSYYKVSAEAARLVFGDFLVCFG